MAVVRRLCRHVQASVAVEAHEDARRQHDVGGAHDIEGAAAAEGVEPDAAARRASRRTWPRGWTDRPAAPGRARARRRCTARQPRTGADHAYVVAGVDVHVVEPGEVDRDAAVVRHGARPARSTRRRNVSGTCSSVPSAASPPTSRDRGGRKTTSGTACDSRRVNTCPRYTFWSRSASRRSTSSVTIRWARVARACEGATPAGLRRSYSEDASASVLFGASRSAGARPSSRNQWRSAGRSAAGAGSPGPAAKDGGTVGREGGDDLPRPHASARDSRDRPIGERTVVSSSSASTRNREDRRNAPAHRHSTGRDGGSQSSSDACPHEKPKRASDRRRGGHPPASSLSAAAVDKTSPLPVNPLTLTRTAPSGLVPRWSCA